MRNVFFGAVLSLVFIFRGAAMLLAEPRPAAVMPDGIFAVTLPKADAYSLELLLPHQAGAPSARVLVTIYERGKGKVREEVKELKRGEVSLLRWDSKEFPPKAVLLLDAAVDAEEDAVPAIAAKVIAIFYDSAGEVTKVKPLRLRAYGEVMGGKSHAENRPEAQAAAHEARAGELLVVPFNTLPIGRFASTRNVINLTYRCQQAKSCSTKIEVQIYAGGERLAEERFAVTDELAMDLEPLLYRRPGKTGYVTAREVSPVAGQGALRMWNSRTSLRKGAGKGGPRYRLSGVVLSKRDKAARSYGYNPYSSPPAGGSSTTPVHSPISSAAPSAPPSPPPPAASPTRTLPPTPPISPTAAPASSWWLTPPPSPPLTPGPTVTSSEEPTPTKPRLGCRGELCVELSLLDPPDSPTCSTDADCQVRCDYQAQKCVRGGKGPRCKGDTQCVRTCHAVEGGMGWCGEAAPDDTLPDLNSPYWRTKSCSSDEACRLRCDAEDGLGIRCVPFGRGKPCLDIGDCTETRCNGAGQCVPGGLGRPCKMGDPDGVCKQLACAEMPEGAACVPGGEGARCPVGTQAGDAWECGKKFCDDTVERCVEAVTVGSGKTRAACSDNSECRSVRRCTPWGTCSTEPSGSGVSGLGCDSDADCGEYACRKFWTGSQWFTQCQKGGEGDPCDPKDPSACQRKQCWEGERGVACGLMPTVQVGNYARPLGVACSDDSDCRHMSCDDHGMGSEGLCVETDNLGVDGCEPFRACKYPKPVVAETEAPRGRLADRGVKAASLGREETLSILKNVEESFVLGKPSADNTVYFFQDLHCGMCTAAFGDIIQRLGEGDLVGRGALKVVFVDFPLGMFKDSVELAQAARCAGGQGRYYEFLKELYTRSPRPSGISSRIAADLKLDLNEFEQCMHDAKGREVIKRNFERGRRLKVDGTPHFFINGVSSPGYRPLERFLEDLSAAGVK